MRQTITISLPKDMKKELDRLTRSAGRSRSDIVRQSLGDYLFEQRFRRLRARLVPYARAKGVFTDEDVFERVS